MYTLGNRKVWRNPFFEKELSAKYIQILEWMSKYATDVSMKCQHSDESQWYVFLDTNASEIKQTARHCKLNKTSKERRERRKNFIKHTIEKSILFDVQSCLEQDVKVHLACNLGIRECKSWLEVAWKHLNGVKSGALLQIRVKVA